MAHATDLPVSMKQLNRIRKLMKEKQSEDQEQTTRCTLDQKMADNVTQKSSSQGENKEDVGLHGMIGKEMRGREIAPKASQFAAANHEAHDLSFKTRDMYPDEEDGSDIDSDSDCNSSSEAPALSCGTESLKFSRKENLAKSCGAQWDVFRRQDVPKLMEYIRKHSNELNEMHCFRKHVSSWTSVI